MVIRILICMLLAAGIFCNRDDIDWGECPSYIVATDTISKIYVLDDTGGVITSISPLQDSMTGIWSPTLINGSEELAFLSRSKPGDPPYLYVTDRSGKKLTAYEIGSLSDLDGSPTYPELVFVSGDRISILDTEDEKASTLFNDTKMESEAVDTIFFRKAMAPAFSPDGEVVAFMQLGYYYDNPGGQIIEVPRMDIGVVNRDGTGYHLLTADMDEPFPALTKWLKLCWTQDGNWLLAVTSTDGKMGIVYQMPFKEGASEISITPVNRDWFDSYAYVTASPTGDTLLLGTTPNFADLYVVEFNDEEGRFHLASQVAGRLTSQQVYADPDWGPGTQ
jgi:hypothetical protein